MGKEVILVSGLGYGDEGKGTIVDYLVRTRGAMVIVRYNGGAQAGHNVVTPDGLHHTFSQFGSGTFVPDVKTHLSRFMIINPLSMIREEEHLQGLGTRDAFSRISIDRNALVTTPFQIAVNRLLEIWQGDKKHNSCGIGVGQTIEDYLRYGDKVLFAKDLQNSVFTERALRFLQKVNYNFLESRILGSLPKTEAVERELEWLVDENIIDDLTKDLLDFAKRVEIVDESYLGKLLKVSSPVIFEGAQGVLLDRKYGFYPFITKTDITFANAYKLLESAEYTNRVTRIGVLRWYLTRHGAGPFVTEDNNLAKYIHDPYNPENQWQGKLRIGWFDLLAVRYGISVNEGIDYLALTNLDQLSKPTTIKVCVSYEYSGEKITTLRKPIASIRNGELSQILFHCKPKDFLEFRKWQEFISFLQSKDGLNVPVKILSFSSTWEGKILN